MLEEQGVVVEVSDDYAWIRTERQSSCGQCAASKGCGTASLAKVLGRKANEIRVVNHLGVKVGDTVRIGLEEQALLRGSFALYLLPLLTMFLVAGFANWLIPNSGELLSIVAGLIGLGLGLLSVHFWSMKLADQPSYQPVLINSKDAL